MVFGQPLECPQMQLEEELVLFGLDLMLRDAPSQSEIDCYHSFLLDGFKETFDKHKAAYGWSQKTLMIV